jgi:hypothetical protein
LFTLLGEKTIAQTDETAESGGLFLGYVEFHPSPDDTASRPWYLGERIRAAYSSQRKTGKVPPMRVPLNNP